MSNKRILKHFVRYDWNGKLIPGGNIRAKSAPKVGTWVEVNDNECCNPTTTTTTTIAWPEGDCFTVYLHGNIVSGTVWELRYCGEIRETVIYAMEMPEETVCVNQIPVLVSGIGTWDLGEACTTTTTTTDR